MNCLCCGISRREFLKLTTLFSTSALLSLASNGCHNSQTLKSFQATNTDKQPVRIGYLPIVDAAPLLVAHAKELYQAEGLSADPPRLFRSWIQLVEAFQARQVNVIHMLMPATLWMRYAHKFPAKIVAWNHTNGSALTVLPTIDKLEDLGGQTIAVPFWYSIHNVVLQLMLKQHGLTAVIKPRNAVVNQDEVNLVSLPPPDMVSALSNRSIAGYIVAEPFNAEAENLQVGKVLRFVGDVWKDHACCVVLMHEEDVTQRRDWTQQVVNALVKSQQWMRGNRPEVAYILSKDGGKYTPHPLPVLQKVLTYYDSDFYRRQGAITHPEWRVNRIDFQPYPFPSYTAELVRLLKQTRLEGDVAFLEQLQPEQVAQELVDDSFVKQALEDLGGPQSFGLALNLLRTETIQV